MNLKVVLVSLSYRGVTVVLTALQRYAFVFSKMHTKTPLLQKPGINGLPSWFLSGHLCCRGEC